MSDTRRPAIDILDPITTVSIVSGGRKAALAAAAAIAVLFAVFTVRWGIGNSVSSRADMKELGKFAVGYAPDDPQTHYALAGLLDETFDPEDARWSNAEYELATALSPHNYLLWLEFGRSLERTGQTERAEAAFRRAKTLAPNYSIVDWNLGNALLRQSRDQEAIKLMTAAAESDARYAEPAASMIWQVFEGDINLVLAALDGSPSTRSKLVLVLVREKRLDEAFSLWNSFDPAEQRERYASIGQTLYTQLVEAREFRRALQVIAAISADRLNEHKAGRIFDGDFEERPAVAHQNIFDWTIPDGKDPRIGRSGGNRHGGSFGLLLSFSPGSTSFHSISQTVAVEPGKRYEFEIFVRSELRSTASLRWEIANAKDGSRIAATDPLNGLREWSQVRLEFEAANASDGIVIRIVKECQTGQCPADGNIWFDDASIRPAE